MDWTAGKIMRWQQRASSAWLVLLLVLAPLPASAMRRHALVIGENVGLRGDETLHFAESDARRMADVLQQLGGVAPTDLTLLVGATANEVRRSLEKVLGRIETEDQLIVYISSHASDGQLHLANTELPMRELRSRLDAAPAAVVLLVLDTCDSGSIVTKGLRATPGSSPVAIAEQPSVRGRAIIGAALGEGFAQESDLLGGSVFTQHLIAGLRGAADVSRDGQITLQEAYTYASQRTLDSTFEAQRPTFSFQLAGERDLVLSDVGRGHARLHLDFPEAGEWLLSSMDGGATSTKFVKAQGPATLAMEPGTYRLQGMMADGGRATVVTIPAQGVVTLRPADLRPAEVSFGARKGTMRTWELGTGVAIGPAATEHAATTVGVELGVRRLRALGPLLLGTGLKYRVGTITKDDQFQHEFELTGETGLSAVSWGWGELRVLAQVSALLIRQDGVPGGVRYGLGPRIGVAPELAFHKGRFSFALSSGVGMSFYKTEGQLQERVQLLPVEGRLLWGF